MGLALSGFVDAEGETRSLNRNLRPATCAQLYPADWRIGNFGWRQRFCLEWLHDSFDKLTALPPMLYYPGCARADPGNFLPKRW